MISLTVGGSQYKVETSKAIPIHTVISETCPWRCFGIEPVSYGKLYKIEGCSGCNCDRIDFCPHANGTHIESRAHVYENGERVMSSVKNLAPLIVAKLINFDKIFEETIAQEHCQAVIVRSSLVAHSLASFRFDFTGTNPPFISPEAMEHILNMFPCVQVLLVDLPSVDPESDGGQLLAHKVFFSSSQTVGIVELCHIQAHIQEGLYALSLNVAPFDSDASPCAPIIYPLLRYE